MALLTLQFLCMQVEQAEAELYADVTHHPSISPFARAWSQRHRSQGTLCWCNIVQPASRLEKLMGGLSEAQGGGCARREFCKRRPSSQKLPWWTDFQRSPSQANFLDVCFGVPPKF